MMRTPLILAAAIAALTASAPDICAAQASPAPSATAPSPATLYAIESLRTGKLPTELSQQLAALTSLQQVEDLLKANHVAFLWRSGEINSTDMSPDFMRQLDQLPLHDLFITRQQDGVLIGVILATRPAPPAPAAGTAPPASSARPN